MTHPKSLAQLTLNALLVCTMLFQPVSAASLHTRPITMEAESAAQTDSTAPAPLLPQVETARSPLADVLQRQVMAQAARVEPTPVSLGTPLPPGTVSSGESNPVHFSQVYLPLVLSDSKSGPREIALDPHQWMAATKAWEIYELRHILYGGTITVRYPSIWEPANLLTLGNQDNLHIARLSEQVQIIVEDDIDVVPCDAHYNPHPDILRYREMGYSVEEVTVKDLQSWVVTPPLHTDSICKEVIVAMPEAWVRFRHKQDNTHVCRSHDIFELILSSLQIRMGASSQPTQIQEQNPISPQAISARDYNRTTALNYQLNWCDQNNNDDNCYFYCNTGCNGGGTACDGAHYLAHILQIGGFPIHWNAGQDHNNPIVFNTNSQRSYVLGVSGVSAGTSATDRSKLKPGDVIYVNGSGSWCWGFGVWRMSGTTPYVSMHSTNKCDVQYSLYYCGTNPYYEYVHIDANEDHVQPRINGGLTLSPSTQELSKTVSASFNVYNYGGSGGTLELRVTTPLGDFATTSCTMAVGGSCSYSQSREFYQTGSVNAYAQMRINEGSGFGGWQNIPVQSGINPVELNVVLPAAVKISSALTLSPNELDHNGGSVQAQFSVKNYGEVGTTEQFRARATQGSVTFSETGDVVLNANQIYDYRDAQIFSQPGVYQAIAEHKIVSGWTALIGDGSDYVRVKEPPPDKPWWQTAYPTTCGYAGEPVNTSNGNYFYDSTDLSENTPSPVLEVNRWYNALTAPRFEGPFGYGSAWTYDMSVMWRSDKTALVRMADGHPGYFIGEIDPDDPLNMSGTYYGQEQDIGNILVRNPDSTAILKMANQKTYHFDDTGRITKVTGQNPTEITVVYSDTLPVQLVHSTGVSYTLAYSGTLITGITSSNGRAVTYTYSTTGDLLQLTRPDGTSYTYEYDENHRLTEARGPNGDAFVGNVYDAEGRVIRQYDQTGQESVFTYGADITEPRIYTDALGNTLTHIYDSEYRLIREVDALGYTTVYTRDAVGNVLERQDKDGAIWRYTYDERGNQLTETDPLGNTWTSTYDAHNNLTSHTDPTGRTWFYEYDAHDRLLRTTDPVGYSREYEYDAQGNLVWERDEAGGETWYAYNELGLRTVITDALSHVTRMDYDAWGNQTVYTDANGNVALFFYDALNRLERSIDPAGTVITFTYDAMGNLLAQPNEMGQVRTYTYDEHDRIIAETDFNGKTTRYGYDALGRRVVITDALGYTMVYTYNAVGQLTAHRNKDGAVQQYEYDPMGRLVREIDPLGRVTEYVYDAAGRQVEVRRPCATTGAACVDGFAVSQTVYDAAGRIIEEHDPRGAVTRYAHDAVGRAAVITDTYGYTRTTSYDPTGRVIQETDPLGAPTLYEYDLLGQIITTTDALGFQTFNVYDAVGRIIQTVNARGYTTTFVYDANDRVSETWDAQGNVVRYTYDDKGQLLSVTDALSRTTTYTYDANGNRLTETNPRGHTTTYVYDALNRVIEVIEPAGCCGAGNRFTVYDAAGRVIQEADALGHTRIITYDVAGRRIAERSPLGYTTVYTYDVADNLIARQEPTGAVWQFEYDVNGNQTRQIDPLGYVYTTEYDLLNRAVREVDPLGAVAARQYDGAGRVTRQTDPRNAITRYAYDLLGRTVEETDALGFTRVITYDGAGNRVAEQDARGFITTYVYDELDREIAQTDALGHSRYTLYDAAGQAEAVVDYKGYATRYEYDVAGNPIRTTDALSHTASTEYDALNRPVASTDALGHTRTTDYDLLGRVVSEKTALGHTTVYTYNAEGWQTARRDALGGVWLTGYDAAGRPVRETDPLGRVQTTTYDALGRAVARTDALGRVTTLTYDPAGRLTVITGPDGTTQQYTYDVVGNILTERDGNGNLTRYEYDLNNRLLRKTDPLGRVWRYRYDAAGNLLETLQPSGARIIQEYDALNRLVSSSPLLPGEAPGVVAVQYAYDANGNRAVMTDTLGVTYYVYNALNQLIGSTDPAGRTALYAYNANGQRTNITYPDGGTAAYAYDADGNLSAVTVPDGQATIYLYDALGRSIRVTQGNGVVVETEYDAVGNTLCITQSDAGGATFARHTYTVDSADRRVYVIEEHVGQPISLSYTYDDLDRLTDSLASDGRETHYAFDNAGNRIAMWGIRSRNSVTETYRVDYTYNAANQLLRAVDSATGMTTYTYNVDGNRIAERAFDRLVEYEYDAENRLTAAQVKLWQNSAWRVKDGITEQYVYDGAGRRVRKNTFSVALSSVISRREYRYDDVQMWDVLQTYTVAATSDEARYLYDGAFHKLAYWNDGAAGYFQNDGLGGVLGATGVDGAAPAALMRYGDYGENLGESDVLPTEDGYTGYERDAYTGLNYARYRYYDVATGTFLTVDPFMVDYTELLNVNRYLYVQADPVNKVDPLGLLSLKGLVGKVTSTVKNIATRMISVLLPRPAPVLAQKSVPPQPSISTAKSLVTTGKQSSNDAFANQNASNRFLTLSQTTCGRKPTFAVGGWVTDANTNLSISGAKVEVGLELFFLPTFDPHSSFSYTDLSGRYLVSNITFVGSGNHSTYEIRITATGYQSHIGNLKVYPNTSNVYSASLTPLPPPSPPKPCDADEMLRKKESCEKSCTLASIPSGISAALICGGLGMINAGLGVVCGAVGAGGVVYIDYECKNKCSVFNCK